MHYDVDPVRHYEVLFEDQVRVYLSVVRAELKKQKIARDEHTASELLLRVAAGFCIGEMGSAALVRLLDEMKVDAERGLIEGRNY